MSDIKKDRKQSDTKTKVKKTKTTTNRTNKTKKTYTKVIAERKNNTKSKINRLCTISLIFVVTIIFLFFLTNRTFFRNEYKIKNLTLDIPRFMFFIGDEDGVLTLKTWRNYESIKAYFDEYLSNLNRFDFYNCSNEKVFYYDEDRKLAIYDIDVERKFILKTITINYEIIDSSKVCDL